MGEIRCRKILIWSPFICPAIFLLSSSFKTASLDERILLIPEVFKGHSGATTCRLTLSSIHINALFVWTINILQREGFEESPSFYRLHITFFDAENHSWPSQTYESALFTPKPKDTSVYCCQMNNILFFLTPDAPGIHLIIEVVLVSLRVDLHLVFSDFCLCLTSYGQTG